MEDFLHFQSEWRNQERGDKSEEELQDVMVLKEKLVESKERWISVLYIFLKAQSVIQVKDQD